MAVGLGQLELGSLDHVVHFYGCDDDLVAVVGAHLVEGLRQGEIGVVVATEAHRLGFGGALRAAGIDPAQAERDGSLVLLDAEATLALLLVDGRPDQARVTEHLGSLLARLTATGRPVRAFGEMVGLLWETGEVTSAIELEDRWNELAERYEFSLFCAYPAVDGRADLLDAVDQICRRHSHVVTGDEDSARAGDPTVGAACQAFAGTGQGVRAARRFLVHTLAQWGCGSDLSDDAALVVTELASNAVRHSQSAFVLTVARATGALRVSVSDGGAALPELRHPEAYDTSGRGVAIVASMSTRWGVEVTAGGKVVWAELPG